MKKHSENTLTGLVCMLMASFMFSVMTACVYEARIADPSVPASVVSFVRVLVNLAILIIPAMFGGGIFALFGDMRPSLWFRGLFGGISLMLFFFAIQAIGAGEGSFIQSSNGLFVVLLAPFILSEQFSFRSLVAIAGSITGLYFLFDPHLSGSGWNGKFVALASGFFAGLSNLMVARSGKSNSPMSVVFYFCFVSVFVHLPYFYFYPAVIPTGKLIWMAMIGAGVTASFGQIFMTKAYQSAPASFVSAVSYAGPVFSLVWSILFFGDILSARSLIGCLLVLLFGILLPFLRSKVPVRI